ncbi:MAG: hypothetical protein EZS28_018228 [Streblomastix strix]|uniref:Uncharacterized protein n=1 Tax=Streblomastix strix TaxID=222440 RepID=A0A5J4VUF9_9EUKA|nr:MAG: hypothetical protein EZS28_018228 [Streblomastix strix]
MILPTHMATFCEYTQPYISQLRHGILYEKVENKENKILTNDQEKQLVQTILKKSDERQLMSHIKIKEVTEDMNRKSSSDGVVRRLIDRNSVILESINAKPIGNGRTNFKEGDARKYEDTLEQEVVCLPPDVIYCIYESGIQFFMDARSKKVVVRRQDDATEVNIPLNRNEPKMSLLGAISLSCEAIPPLLILK